MKKSNHSKKIVKQLKKEYKEDLEKSSLVPEPVSNTDGKIFYFFHSVCTYALYLTFYAPTLCYFIFIITLCLNCSSHQNK